MAKTLKNSLGAIKDAIKVQAELDSDVDAKASQDAVSIRHLAVRKKFGESLQPNKPRWHKYIAPAATLKTPDERCEYICELMSTGLWRAQFNQPLCKLWGIKPSTMYHYVTASVRTVRRSLGDRETIRTNVITFLDSIAHDSSEDGDKRSAIAAMRLLADITGLVVQKHEISGPDGAPIQMQALRDLTDEELNTRILKEAAVVVATSGMKELPSGLSEALAAVVHEGEVVDLAPLDVVDSDQS